jgi:uncharacterized protein (UPF0262 family)
MGRIASACARNVSDKPKNSLIDVMVDASIAAPPSPEAEHERRMAIHDLLERNSFALKEGKEGPYRLALSTAQGRLMFEIANEASEKISIIGLSMTPFKALVKDYFLICESYYQAIRNATPAQIETIDMARRGLHNEGSELLKERLQGKIDLDFDTARRLFTLVCVLYWRG